MGLFTGLMYVIFIIMGVTSGLTPMFSRQSTPFGVAISGKHEEIEKYKKRYAIYNIVASLVLGLPLFIFPFMENQEQAEMWSAIYVMVGIGLFLLYSFGLYFKYRTDIQKWKEHLPKEEKAQAKRVVVDTKYHENLQTKSHFTFFIWQFAIIVIGVLIALAFYGRIPDEIPINWNAQFEVNHTIPKSVWSILALPGLQLLMIPVLNMSNHAIVKSKQRLSPLDPKTASEKSRLFREAWSNLLFAITIATQLLISFLFLYSLFGQGRNAWLIFVVTVIYLLLAAGSPLYLTLKYGQAGEKLLDEEDVYYDDPDEEDNWKFGLLYYNKEDPSVFVERRFGIGSTFNLARWQAWLFIGGIILFTVLTLVWSFLLT